MTLPSTLARLPLAGLFLSALFPIAQGAEDRRSVSPADWGTAAEVFAERLEIPTPFPRRLMFVRCFGLVREDGAIAGVGCNPNREGREYSEKLGLAIGAAADGLRLQPAEIDGTAVPLRRFPFSVMVAPQPDNPIARPLMKVVANHVLDTSRYGVDYIAPQQVFTDVSQPKCRTSRELTFAYTVEIAANGVPGELTITDDNARDICESELRDYLANAVFLPAIHDDRFVDALFLGSVALEGDER